MLISALLGWASTSLSGAEIDPIVGSVIGILLTQAIAYVTPLTKQYGVGADK
jgi:hypothetical protein